MDRSNPAAFRSDDTFEPEERPTRPGDPPPGTQSWPTLTPRKGAGPLRTATSRWRALASVAIEGGIVRESYVDRREKAETDEPPESAGSAETTEPAPPAVESDMRLMVNAPAAREPRLPSGPRGTLRMPARGDTGPTGTVRMRARPERQGATSPRHTRRRGWLPVLAAAAMCTMLGGLTAANNSSDVVPAPIAPPSAAADPGTPVELSAADPAATPIAPAPTVSFSATHPPPVRSAPKRPRPHAGSSTF